MSSKGTILWWGRFDPDYSRNRILRHLLAKQGWRVLDFHPLVSGLGDLQATLQRIERPDIVWVPCFRQRDLAAASRWARRYKVPLIFDPLIAAYDKQVDERRKFPADSSAARRLLAWELGLFARADRVVADTLAHATYFQQVLGVSEERIAVLMVGAEEGLFQPCQAYDPNDPLELLFFGSFIPLQGPEIIVQAARLCKAPGVVWTLLGNGPLRSRCEELAQGLANVRFEDWYPYEQLPRRICQADILLGIFGDTPKAERVVPNKAYQALACGKALVTRSSGAYPQALLTEPRSGISWVHAGDPRSLAVAVEEVIADHKRLQEQHVLAGETYKRWFSNKKLTEQLADLLAGVVK